MNILVCGGAGFIGSAFIRNNLKNNSDLNITNLDLLTIGSNLKNLKDVDNFSNYKFINDDIRNESVVDDLVKDTDVIINFAAESHVDRSIANPKPFLDTNILGTYSILEATRKFDKQFIHVSTDEIYGDAYGQSSFDENSQINPSNPYAATKAAADHLVSSYHRTYGINCITTRCTNNFGSYQFPEKLIPKTIIRCIKNLKIPLYGDGMQIRSWIYVNDHVQAIENLISKGKPGNVYNITAYEEITNKTIVEKILDILEKPHSMIEHVGDRPGHDKRYSINCSKIENEIGWKHQYNFDDALKQTVTWYLDNQSWWEPLIDENTLDPQPWTVNSQ
jgi:dTDP-glucose 4,6-dehydratase